MWHQVINQQVSLWKVKAWEQYPWLIHGFTTKTSGNLALHTGEEQGKIIANRRKISDNIGVDAASWVTGNQVHETNIKQVLLEHKGSGATTQITAFANTDGLITDQANILLASFYADCVPLFFVEPNRRIIAMAHAGWRGTIGGIGLKMLQRFKSIYQLEPDEVEVAIGPSIGPCCYQVGDEVAKQFPVHAILQKENGTFLDLWQVNQQQFIDAGIALDHLYVAEVCTYCNHDFFSYRREGSKAGRMAALLLKKDCNDLV